MKSSSLTIVLVCLVLLTLLGSQVRDLLLILNDTVPGRGSLLTLLIALTVFLLVIRFITAPESPRGK